MNLPDGLRSPAICHLGFADLVFTLSVEIASDDTPQAFYFTGTTLLHLVDGWLESGPTPDISLATPVITSSN
jgi:hypothetical protein